MQIVLLMPEQHMQVDREPAAGLISHATCQNELVIDGKPHSSHQLTVPPHRRVTYGGRAITVAGPSTCNSLPKRLRDPSNSL